MEIAGIQSKAASFFQNTLTRFAAQSQPQGVFSMRQLNPQYLMLARKIRFGKKRKGKRRGR
jgi:hypothetical protein